MPGISERVYPKEMDKDGVHNIQGVMYRVFTLRYTLAKNWLKQHFKKDDIRIIDIACGSGYGTEILSEAGEVLGVDLDPEAVDYANKHYSNGRTSFTVGNADDFTFLDKLGKFDAIVSLATVEHVDDADAYMSWIYRSLNPGGAAVVCFPSVVTMDWAIPHHKRDISRKDARRMFSRTGFKIARDYYQNHKLDIRHLLNEIGHPDNEIPVPPLSHWIKYYLTHPHHLALRCYEMTIGRGIHFGDQEYLLLPEPVSDTKTVRIGSRRTQLEESYG